MERTWRWFGKKDKITLAQLKQIGVEGIVTALHDVPLGEVWTRMPVVTDPGVLNPYEFIGTVINKRLPNPFMPDAPQRIATDTSQKLSIRFGETIKKYIDRGLDKSNLVLIPLVLAGYARYLKALDDNLKPFEPSSDPLLAELQAIVAPLEVGKADQDYSCLKNLYSRKDVFGLDLYEAGFGEQIEGQSRSISTAVSTRATLC